MRLLYALGGLLMTVATIGLIFFGPVLPQYFGLLIEDIHSSKPASIGNAWLVLLLAIVIATGAVLTTIGIFKADSGTAYSSSGRLFQKLGGVLISVGAAFGLFASISMLNGFSAIAEQSGSPSIEQVNVLVDFSVTWIRVAFVVCTLGSLSILFSSVRFMDTPQLCRKPTPNPKQFAVIGFVLFFSIAFVFGFLTLLLMEAKVVTVILDRTSMVDPATLAQFLRNVGTCSIVAFVMLGLSGTGLFASGLLGPGDGIRTPEDDDDV